jgi:hypothetical protein
MPTLPSNPLSRTDFAVRNGLRLLKLAGRVDLALPRRSHLRVARRNNADFSENGSQRVRNCKNPKHK